MAIDWEKVAATYYNNFMVDPQGDPPPWEWYVQNHPADAERVRRMVQEAVQAAWFCGQIKEASQK